MDESKLIFIISQPRSGSTLLQKLVSNNSLVDTVSEPWLLLPLLSVYKPELVEAKYNYGNSLKGFFDYLDKKEAKEEFRSGLKELILKLYKVGNSSQYFIDKTPRYYEIIPEIMAFFPNAKFLVLKRNPFASLHSMLSTWSNGKVDYKMFKNFYRDFLAAPFLIQEFCEAQETNPNVRIVKYEDIVGNPDAAISGIYQWLNIPFDKTVLDFGSNEKVKGIFGDDVYKKEPLKEIKDSKSDSWKSALENKEVSTFFYEYQEYLSCDFIRKYGYSKEKFNMSSSVFGKNLFKEYISNLKKDKKIG
jgi:hypothetical protein